MSRFEASDDPELRAVSDALRRGRSTREIAAILYGEAAVSRHWTAADGSMRTRTRRRIDKAHRLMAYGHPEAELCQGLISVT